MLILVGHLCVSGIASAKSNQLSVHCNFTSYRLVDAKPKTDLMKKEIRHFVITNYRPLIFEITKGSGDYLTALMELLNLNDEQIAELASFNRCLLGKNLSIPDFARAMAELN